MYNGLEPKAKAYYIDAAPELTEMQNAERVVYLTAVSAIETELNKRKNTRSAVAITGQVLTGLISTSLSM